MAMKPLEGGRKTRASVKGGGQMAHGEERSVDVRYTEISGETALLYRTRESPEADQAQDLLEKNNVSYEVKMRPDYPGRPFLQAYLSEPLLVGKIGSFKGIDKIKEFILIERRRRAKDK